jgi:hypothetical protein
LSWAARRKTTRIEDTACCLLGIFGINMSPLYGEGERAFRRLQEEITKSTPDMSTFSWRLDRKLKTAEDSGRRVYCSLLTPSPSAYMHSNIVIHDSYSAAGEFAVTNLGIRLREPVVVERFINSSYQRYTLLLGCVDETTRGGFCVKLRKFGSHGYLRDSP